MTQSTMVGYFLNRETDRYHVQVYVSTGGLKPSHEWAFICPSKSDHPYVFTRQQADDCIRTHTLQSGKPDSYRLFRLSPMP